MKTLLLMRHAKSSWDDSSVTDHERLLNERGRRDAPVMGERLANSAFAPDHILCSTAHRARQTADLLLEALGFDGPVDVRDGIYHATPRELMAGIAQAGAGERLLVIGHNPGLGELVELLTNDHRHMPTAAIAIIEMPITEWSEIGHAKGRLVEFMKPKDED